MVRQAIIADRESSLRIPSEDPITSSLIRMKLPTIGLEHEASEIFGLERDKRPVRDAP
jgi:hypothetical protein